MAILSWIALFAADLLKKYGFETAKWVAQRAFLLALALGVGPIVLFKAFSWITQYMMTYASSKVGGAIGQPIVVELVGVGGWIASELRLPECFSVFLSFCLLNFLLKLVRVK